MWKRLKIGPQGINKRSKIKEINYVLSGDAQNIFKLQKIFVVYRQIATLLSLRKQCLKNVNIKVRKKLSVLFERNSAIKLDCYVQII